MDFAQVYHASAQPVEDFFREQGVLMDFQITGGIPETLPRLMQALAPYRHCLEQPRPQRAQASQ